MQVGIQESDIDYSIVGSTQLLSKLTATLEASDLSEIMRLGSGYELFDRPQGHLLDVINLVRKMNQVSKGFVPTSYHPMMHERRAYGVQPSVSPWLLVTRMDVLDVTKAGHPTPETNSLRLASSLSQPDRWEWVAALQG